MVFCRKTGLRGDGLFRLLGLVAFLPILLFTVVTPTKSQELDRVRIQAHWLEQFEFAGFYVAKEYGFYEEVGLALDILPHRTGETDVVATVLNGEAEFGVNYSSILADFYRGEPIVALAALFQDSPLVLIARDEPTLKAPKDLEGRRIMIGGDALSSVPIRALMFSQNIGLNDFELQQHSYNLDDLISGKTDAMTAYIGNEPFELSQRGIPFQVFDPGKLGLSFYENILFTTAKEAEENPQRVARFRKATLRGFMHAFDNIEETAKLIHEKYNEQNKSVEALIYEGKELRKRAMVRDIPLGQIEVSRLNDLANAFRLMGVSLTNKPVEGFVWTGALAPEERPARFTPEEHAFIESKVVAVATTTNWPPFAFVSEQTGAVAGIGYDFWKEIATRAGLKYDVNLYDNFSRELEDIQEKRQDLAFSVGDTPQRRKYALFSEPYASFPLAIATSKEEHFIPDISRLDGKTIAIGRNFTAHQMMREAYPHLNYLPSDNIRDGLQAVSNGEAYAYIDIAPALVHAINRYGFTNLKISGETDLICELRLMARRDYPELISIANKVIATISPERRQDILNHWINVQYERGFDLNDILPWLIGIGTLILIPFAWLVHSKQQAERANRMKSEFLALMSHDLRTPLNVIMGFSDMMRSQSVGPIENPQYRDYANDIYQSGELLVSLINDILDLSKIEAGKYVLDEEEVDLSAVVNRTIHGCAILASPRGITIRSEIPDDLQTLYADERVLTQIFNNLLSNAIKYSDKGGTIRLTAQVTSQGEMLVKVIDTGIGMSADEVKRVTEPFERLNREHNKHVEGTGLGLHLCLSFMRLLSGKLQIDSKSGIGTTVTLTFPAERIHPRPS